MSNRICTVDGCENPLRCKGLCNGHYLKWLHYGDPLTDRRPRRAPCTMDDCETLAVTRGLCPKHYKRWQTHGDPAVVQKHDPAELSRRALAMRPPLVERYLASIEFGDDDECWIWTGRLTSRGYGMIGSAYGKRKLFYAHRLAILFECRELPDDLFALHHCDNPPCVNPRHLYAGTIRDNARDMRERGRGRNGNSDKTHCVNGHALTPENIYIYGTSRVCRPCLRARSRQYRIESRAA